MALRLVGAGVGRTGTMSLKQALEELLGGPCYHMFEVFQNPDHVPVWHAAARGEAVDWRALLEGYVAIVDWPGAAFWPEIAAAFPEAPVLLSHRSPDSWWKSASNTIFRTFDGMPAAQRAMIEAFLEVRFTGRIHDGEACKRAMEEHNAEVRAADLGDRLFEWETGDGWPTLCRALGLPVPSHEFPHRNSTEEFRARSEASPS